MRFAIIVLVLLWFCSGLAGAFLLEELDRDHWRDILLGPITLVNGIKESNDPTELPGNPRFDDQ